MNTLYLDLISGVSGDMFVGALLDLGVDFSSLERELSRLGLHEYHLHVARGEKSGISGTKFNVHLEGEHSHDHGHAHGHEHGAHTHFHDEIQGRDFSQIRKLIAQSTLSDWVKEKAIAVFHRLAVAEGQIHGVPAEQVTFHEVGAVDSIVDIVGACIGLELLGKPRLLASAVVDGNGWMECAHGRFPIPAPATLAVLGARGIPLTQCSEPQELITPTGAALLAELVESFGPMSGLAAQKIGYGLGSRDNQTRPNVLRAVLGASSQTASPQDWETDTVAILETNLDNISAETLGYFLDKALAEGALDVFHTPIQMKKNRPGVLLTILCAEADADKFSELILRETTALGVRRHQAERRKLRREFVPVKTPWGDVDVKIGRLNGEVLQAAPEFESCRRLAEQAHVPLKEVHAAALAAWSKAQRS
jgi:pyridinium-3,5-bisthiocarboxylic acid mononucleotide nickel chelatase